VIKYRAIPAKQLAPEMIQAWSRLQRADPRLDSPYFRPEFTLAVASVRPTSEVAVLEDNGQPVGFLPYDRSPRNVGYPIAPEMTDFQGAIVRSDLEWDPKQLARDCGLAALYFDHLLSSQNRLRQYHWIEEPSPYLELSDGFEAYRTNRTEVGGNRLKTVLRKARKLEREVGPLRLEPFSTDGRVFQTLVDWKTQQYYRSRARNVFAEGWTVELLQRLLDKRTEALTGVLSALYAGDQLASIHMGMMSYGVLHHWFPAYNVELHKYSPGLVQMVRTAQAAEELGINRIDLGRGPESYKASLMTGATMIAEAAVDLRPVVRPLKRLWFHATNHVRASRLQVPARWIVRNLRALSRKGVRTLFPEQPGGCYAKKGPDPFSRRAGVS